MMHLENILEKWDNIAIRLTARADIESILAAEADDKNKPYVEAWTGEEHLSALTDRNIMHLSMETSSGSFCGYAVIGGARDRSRNMEIKKIVVTQKGKGYGKEAVSLIKRIAFERLKAHRLWLNIRYYNFTAQDLFESQGFSLEGILRECEFLGGRFISVLVMSMLEEEYRMGNTNIKRP
jgi:RimJ/RimL family protein N-acetyltransferase